MNGEELYERWAGFMLDQNIEVDPWSQLDETDQYAWEKLAETASSESAGSGT